MTEKSHPGLGSGALREALEHTAKLFHRYCAYVSHTSPHAGVTFEDCLEVECDENGEQHEIKLCFEDELRWPVGFCQELWTEEVEISKVRSASRQGAAKRVEG